MMRTIAEGPVQVAEPGDSHRWRWTVVSESGEKESVNFTVTGTAGACAVDGLPARVRQALATEGRSEVERILGDAEIPTLIEAERSG